MLKLLKYFRAKEWLSVLMCFAFVAFQVFLDLKLPDYMSDITMLVQTEGSAMSEIWQAGFKMLGCAFGSMAVAMVTGFFAARLAATLAK